jgi:hypothetical protein
MARDFTADQIATLQSAWTRDWHLEAGSAEAAAPWTYVERNHRMNFDLWHEEDIARRDDLGAERIREAKRTIDRLNQARNDAAEQFDAWLLSQLPEMAADAPLHSETPGMIVDRLSILALKHYHMVEESIRAGASPEQRERCGAKASMLLHQREDLRDCLELLFGQLKRGERAFRQYRQFKMYNDHSTNPQLYGAGEAAE